MKKTIAPKGPTVRDEKGFHYFALVLMTILALFCVMPFILMTLMAVGRIFNSDFGLFYQVPLGSGLLYSTTQTIDTYVYRSLLELNNISMSSAASVFQAIIGFVLVMISNTLVAIIDPDNALF